MKIKSISWRNIFSYGNKENKLDFDGNGMLWQLSGVSGAGKSSLLSLPKLLLFGKTEDDDGKPISVNDIANWINKKGWIRGEIESGQDTYIIERTFAPTSLVIYKNGQQIDKAGKKDMQNVIQTEILKSMPYYIFNNLMTLSLNGGKSFISMTPSDKREIIDKIFSLEIINKIYEYIKHDKKELGNAINNANGQIYSFESSIKVSQNKLNELKEKNNEDNSSVINELNNKLQKIDALYNEQLSLYNNTVKDINDAQPDIKLLYTSIIELKNEIDNIQKQIDLFNQSKCPTCGTPFTGDSFDALRENLSSEYNKRKEQYNEKQSLYTEAVNKTNELQKLSNQIYSNLNKINSKKQELTLQLKSIEASSLNNSEYEAIQQIIAETEKNKKEAESIVIKSNEEMGILDIMDKLYSSDGIKKIMMKENLPMLNSDIAKTLQDINFPYMLEFDESFDPHLKWMNEEIRPQNLSTGEHKKIDAAVLCALLIFLKRRYPQINLICLDETVSSLDYESSTNIIKRLKDVAKEMNMNIFIVSHTQLNENLFDRKISVKKNMGFSEIEIG